LEGTKRSWRSISACMPIITMVQNSAEKPKALSQRAEETMPERERGEVVRRYESSEVNITRDAPHISLYDM